MSEITIDPDGLYCFLDTDVLMHFTTFDQVNWLKFLNAQRVYLVLPITTVSELNKHKDDGSKPHRQERARDLLSKISKLLGSTVGPVRVKEGVFLLIIPREPMVKWSELELDREIHDDRILARIIMFKQKYPDASACFLTNDSSSVMKAIDRNILAITPDKLYLEQIELKSSAQAQIQALQKELDQYKNRLPKLDFGFSIKQGLSKKIICPSESSNEEHVNMLSLYFSDDYTPEEILNKRRYLERLPSVSKNRATDRQIKEFTEEYEKYLDELEPALKRNLMSTYGQKCSLNFMIMNNGTAPATDITIDLEFPLGTLVIDADDEERKIEIPVEPKPSWKTDPPTNLFGIAKIELAIADFSLKNIKVVYPGDPTSRLIHAQYTMRATRRGPFCNKTKDSHIVSYHAQKLQHKDAWRMPPIIAYLILDGKRGFSIDYRIFTDQSLKEITGKLCVLWEDTEKEIADIIDQL